MTTQQLIDQATEQLKITTDFDHRVKLQQRLHSLQERLRREQRRDWEERYERVDWDDQ